MSGAIVKAEGLMLLAAAGVAGFVAWKLWKAGPGILSGNNALTRNAKNADGQSVTAYKGAGIIGTAGAAANAASGGYLASFGQWLGEKAYDLTHPSTDTSTEQAQQAEQAPAASLNRYARAGIADMNGDASGSWSDAAGLDGAAIVPGFYYGP